MIDCEPCITTEPIIIAPNAETLVCRKCGVEYYSRGKNDPGVCRSCERLENAKFKGGPYQGMHISGLLTDDDVPIQISDTPIQEDIDG